MVMRLIVVIALFASFSLAGCLKKAEEDLSMEPNITEESGMPGIEGASWGKSVSVEPAASQTTVIEKPSVQDIQQALKNAGLYEGKVDGIPGPMTREAIESFQSQSGLKSDGKVGPMTWQKLKEYLIK